ncbi:putative tyrosine-protein kinase receptor [Trypoxylus dichotomus]
MFRTACTRFTDAHTHIRVISRWYPPALRRRNTKSKRSRRNRSEYAAEVAGRSSIKSPRCDLEAFSSVVDAEITPVAKDFHARASFSPTIMNSMPLRKCVTVIVVVYLCGFVSCKYCTNGDMREFLSDFKQLEGCKILIGNLQVVLFDRATKQSFENISFPELEEVTGFLLFYQVPGLVNIGKMFPNLKIVRGMQVIHNYAFILYNLPDLEEVHF